MIPKSGLRFSEKDHASPKSMIPKSGLRFSEKDHASPKGMIPFSEKRSCALEADAARSDR
jgi:hypothetical protein